MPYNELNPEETRIIVNKGTEAPGSGELNDHYEPGTYICRQCNAALYESTSKFKSGAAGQVLTTNWKEPSNEFPTPMVDAPKSCATLAAGIWATCLKVRT